MSSQRWAVFLDVDNTLLVDGDVSPGIRAAVRAAQQKGHLFFLNTGRSASFLPQVVREAVDWDGVVAGIGSDVTYGDRILFEKHASRASLKRVADYFLPLGRGVILEGRQATFSIGPNNWGVPSVGDWQTFISLPDPQVSKITFDEVLTDEECALLQPDFTPIRHPDYTEASLAGCNKATGMEVVLRALDIPVSRSIAMGDSHNDWDMLDAAGISVAMGNADPATKARCHVVSPDACDDGVAWAIRKYLL